MPYPKPLSPKSIDRLYLEINLNDNQVRFIRSFVTACANLYGAIFAEDAWKVYLELSKKTETVRLHRRDMYAALGVLRREAVPFYVFEVDEVYSEEKREDKFRLIASRKLVGTGQRRFSELYSVMENAAGRTHYVPQNLLDYVVMPQGKYELELLKVLENLKCTASEYKTRWGTVITCKRKGKYLKEFSYIGDYEEFELQRLHGEIEGYKGDEKKAAEFEKKINSINAAQYLLNRIKHYNTIGDLSPSQIIQYFVDDLSEMGVEPSVKKMNEIMNAVMNMLNNQHLWCLSGWTPKELGKKLKPAGQPTISFGPGLQKAFANGDMDREEIVKMLEAKGIKVEN